MHNKNNKIYYTWYMYIKKLTIIFKNVINILYVLWNEANEREEEKE